MLRVIDADVQLLGEELSGGPVREIEDVPFAHLEQVIEKEHICRPDVGHCYSTSANE
jgi:hypothetical protein